MSKNKLKQAYANYFLTFDKYLKICTEEKCIIVSTEDKHFPHLVGMGHMKQYEYKPSYIFIRDIKDGYLSDGVVYGMQKNIAEIVFIKTKALSQIIKYAECHVLHIPTGLKFGKSIQISESDVVISSQIDNKLIIVVLVEDSSNVFRPKSLLVFNQDSKIYSDAKKIKKSKVINFEKSCIKI